MLDVLKRMMLPAERGWKQNSHRVARRIVVARDKRQTDR